MPFILRGVSLVGVDSVYCPLKDRIEAWERLSTDLNLEHLEKMTSVIPIQDVMIASKNMIEGKSYGRIVVDVNT